MIMSKKAPYYSVFYSKKYTGNFKVPTIFTVFIVFLGESISTESIW